MKKLFILSSLIFLIIGSSCSKEELQVKNDINSHPSILKYTLPPIREFVCGPQTVPPSPYPCPNASCPYCGWDCAFEVDINSWSQIADDYYAAADLLDYYIDQSNAKYFFNNYPDELEILIPELADPKRGPMLDDLQDGTTSVIMHPYYHSELDAQLYIFQLYVVSTGEPPDYSDY